MGTKSVAYPSREGEKQKQQFYQTPPAVLRALMEALASRKCEPRVQSGEEGFVAQRESRKQRYDDFEL